MRPVVCLSALLLICCNGNKLDPAMTLPQPKAPSAPALIHAGDVLATHALLHYEKPVYPAAAHRANIKGNVRLRVLVNERGSVEDILEVMRGDPLLVPNAIAAVRSWM